MDCLYHYCANEKFYSILKGQSIRMGDISKSNDSLELQLFFPELHHTIFQRYKDKPFRFKLGEFSGVDAMRELLYRSERYWDGRFENGNFSNFVVCFSEEKDCLSQWRGYADDGNGGSIGFSLETLRQYCYNSNGVLRLEKVEYLNDQALGEVISSYADFILDNLVDLRDWALKNFTNDDLSPKTDYIVRSEFNNMIADAFSHSLRYKMMPFHEEQEWRMYLSTEGVKNPEWVINKSTPYYGPEDLDRTLNFLNNRIDLRYTNNDLIPFCPLRFDEFPDNPVVEVWLGPKNKARQNDVDLFLRKYGYEKVDVYYSNITYR